MIATRWCLLIVCWFLPTALYAIPRIEVKGLFNGRAVLVIDGKQRLLKQGKTSPEGVTLVTANSKQAVVEVEGARQTLTLSQAIGGAYGPAPEKTAVRLSSGRNGHYMANGNINGLSVRFMVDTGASFIALNSLEARRLGIDYTEGRLSNVHTASGNAPAYEVMLSKVTVGAITLLNVNAMVLEGASPRQILLGNSFLSRVNMRIENSVMILQTKY